jgi:replicative DNA helicase
LPKVYEDIEAVKAGREIGMKTGFKDIDDMIGGLYNSDYIIIAARPSMGKTTLAQQICENIGTRYMDKDVLFYSLEMSVEALTMRSLSGEVDLSIHQLRTGHYRKEKLIEMGKVLPIIAKMPIVYNDRTNIMDEIVYSARRYAMKRPVSLICIDYLQLANTAQRGNRNAEVEAMSRQIKNLARDLDVPIIVLSQLSRGCEIRHTKRPILADLRDSGSIEQDADIVAFLYRAEQYIDENESDKYNERFKKIMIKGRKHDSENIAELIIAKQRNAPTGSAFLGWQNARFTDLKVI